MYQKCVDCPFHELVADPDPNDWYNSDDVAIVCKKTTRIVSNEPTKYQVDKIPHLIVDLALRPYQASKITPPNWCPISITNIRDRKISNILST